MRTVSRSSAIQYLLGACAALIFCLAAHALQAQSNLVIVQLKQPPPNQLKVADLWEVRLNNTSGRTLRIYLHGTAEEATDGQIVDAQSAVIDLPPGLSQFNGNTLAPIKVNRSNSKYKEGLLRTGTVPTGTYRVCVEAILVATSEVVGTDCITQVIQQLTPPMLTSPNDGATVEERAPTFTWLPPSPLRPGQAMRYQMKVVEVIGRQTPYDAVVSNPAWYSRTDLGSPIHTYPISARPFLPGKKYAWNIKAFDASLLLGESEIWWFTYQPHTNPSDLKRDKDVLIGNTDNPDLTPFSGSGFTPKRENFLFQGFNVTEKMLVIDSISKKALKPKKPFLEEVLQSCSGSPLIYDVTKIKEELMIPKDPGKKVFDPSKSLPGGGK